MCFGRFNRTPSHLDRLRSVLSLLADGKFHSEKEISQFLGVSFDTFHDILRSVSGLSLSLEKKDNLGYCIAGGLELLDKALIYNELSNTCSWLDCLEILTFIDSTNSYLLKKANGLLRHAVIAEYQWAGRGRFDRRWLSSFAQDICLSFLCHFPNKLSGLMGLSLVSGIAVVRALQEYGVDNIGLKWPNDLVYKGQKLGGILVESLSCKPGTYSVVIGIGLNLYGPSSVSERAIGQPIMNIYSLHGQAIQRNRLAGLVLKNLLYIMTEFQVKGLSGFMDEWQLHDSLIAKLVTMQTPMGSFEGIARGIDTSGRLRVEIEGKLYSFTSGEVRVKAKA